MAQVSLHWASGPPWQPAAPESQGCWVSPRRLLGQRQKRHQLCPERAKRRAALPRGRCFGRSGQVKSCPFARGSLSFQPQVCQAHPQDPGEEPSKGLPCGRQRERLRCQVGSAPRQQSLSPAPPGGWRDHRGRVHQDEEEEVGTAGWKAKGEQGLKLLGRFHHISQWVP